MGGGRRAERDDALALGDGLAISKLRPVRRVVLGPFVLAGHQAIRRTLDKGSVFKRNGSIARGPTTYVGGMGTNRLGKLRLPASLLFQVVA